ncbi:hypothetical protein HZZ02_11725 [Streptococcus danieliae]|nr:hypothetical protein [Streptococcus danieliae]
MLKWFLLFAFIGCMANAMNLSKKSLENDDDDDDFDNEFTSIRSVDTKTEIEEDWSKKERKQWLIAAIVFIILFLLV